MSVDSLDPEQKKAVDPIAKILANVAQNVKQKAEEDEKDTHGLDFEKTFTKRYRNNSKKNIKFY